MLLDLIALDQSSRVWIYQANRELTYDELDIAREQLFPFMDQWSSHSQELYTYGNIFHKRFLALFVDSHASTGASGCSIDSSVRFITQLGEQLGVDFFDRLQFCYLDQNEDVQAVNRIQLKDAYQNGLIDDNTYFFDNLVSTKKDFLEKWTTHLGESWIKKMI